MDRLALSRAVRLFTVSVKTPVARVVVLKTGACSFHTTSPSVAGHRWRVSTGRSGRGNSYGPLVDLPDWSYADGRPAPINSGQRRRLEKQKTYADFIYKSVHAVGEVKQQIAAAQRSAEKDTAKLRLKPKGSAM